MFMLEGCNDASDLWHESCGQTLRSKVKIGQYYVCSGSDIAVN